MMMSASCEGIIHELIDLVGAGIVPIDSESVIRFPNLTEVCLQTISVILELYFCRLGLPSWPGNSTVTTTAFA